MHSKSEAQQQGITGTVEVIVALDEHSHLVSARIGKSPNAILNNAALAAARQSTYQTEIVNCKPQPAEYIYSPRLRALLNEAPDESPFEEAPAVREPHSFYREPRSFYGATIGDRFCLQHAEVAEAVDGVDVAQQFACMCSG